MSKAVSRVSADPQAVPRELSFVPAAETKSVAAVSVGHAAVAEIVGFAILLGIAAGCADAFMVTNKILGARGGVEYVPWTIWPAAALAWALVCGSGSALVSVIPSLRGWAIRFVMIGIAGLLLGLRIVLFRFQLRANPALFSTVAVIVGALLCACFIVDRAWRTGKKIRAFAKQSLWLTVPMLAFCGTALATTSTPTTRRVPPVAGLPAPTRNVVLIFLDTLRYDHSGMSDDSRTIAPNLNAFSRPAVRFQWGIAPAPWTLPSHVSIMTGLAEWQLGLSAEHQTVKEYPGTLPKRFARRGYDTAAFIANPILHDHSGFEDGIRSYDYPRRALDVCRTAIGVVIAKSSYTRGLCTWTSADVTRRALDYIDAHANRPYFLTLNYFDPHDPYWLPPGLKASVPRRLSMEDHAALMNVLARNTPLDAAARERIVAIYAQAVHGMDASMKPLLDRLARDADDGKTIVAIVADHGEHFGEHNLCGHGNSVYAPLVRVPLAVRARGLDAADIETPASATMLFNAIRALALRDAETRTTTESLVHIFTSEPAISHIAFGDKVRGSSDLWSVAGHGYHLILSDQRAELYSLSDDPNDLHDLSGSQEPRVALLKALHDAQAKSGPRGPDPYENLKGIGYLP